MFETWLHSDLKKPVTVEPLKGVFFSADNEGNLVGVDVTDNGQPARLSGSVYGYLIRADGSTVVVNGTLNENRAYIVFPEAAYAVVGVLYIAIKVGSVTVGACAGYVHRTTTGTIVDPGTIITNIDDLLEAIEQAEEDLAEAIAEIPEDYSDLEKEVAGIISKTLAIKNPIVTALQHVVWADGNGQSYINAVVNAFNAFKLSSITAVYTNNDPVSVITELNSLKQYITVTAHNIDGTTETVASTDYTLSGSLYDGDNTITVKYMDKTTTITVEAEDPEIPSGYTAYDYIKRTLNIGTNNDGSYSIITDFSMSTDYTLDMDLFVPSTSNAVNSYPVCGSRHQGYTPTDEIGIWVNANSQKCGYQYHGKTNRTNASSFSSNIPFAKGEWKHISVKPVGKSQTYPEYAVLSVGDTDYSTGSTQTGAVWQPWFTFFSIGNSATTAYQGGSLPEIGLRIGRTVIRNASGECIHYLIPAYDGTHYGLYDAVEEKIYYSADYYSYFVCENNAS